MKPTNWITAAIAAIATILPGCDSAVLQDIKSFDEAQQTLALLKILALGNQDAQAGRVKPVGEVVARLRAKRADLTSA